MSTDLAVIAGTGALNLFAIEAERTVHTPWGEPSARLARVRVGECPAWFLARHGRPHRIAPHRINYRANIDALRRLGVTRAISINAVGGVDPQLVPGTLVVPDQLIDYSWGRAQSFSDADDAVVQHVEFAAPFDGAVRDGLLTAARRAGEAVIDHGCMAVTQGPRLETAAEIRRLGRDGCSMVGMTGMPEAVLAREAGLDYASLCVVANPGAGLEDQPITLAEIERVLEQAMARVMRVLEHFAT